MTAEHVLALAEALRRLALRSDRDLNAANLYVHNMLVQALLADANHRDPPTQAPKAA